MCLIIQSSTTEIEKHIASYSITPTTPPPPPTKKKIYDRKRCRSLKNNQLINNIIKMFYHCVGITKTWVYFNAIILNAMTLQPPPLSPCHKKTVKWPRDGSFIVYIPLGRPQLMLWRIYSPSECKCIGCVLYYIFIPHIFCM